jgi:ADP-ribose pyrophosphatase YjhB (NUDIX family)
MSMNAIRAKVVCVLWDSGRMLLIRATDPHDGRPFLLPPGGGVEFGESLDQAILREIFEEVRVRLPEAKRLGMLENVFQFDGRKEHELVFVYEADCDDPDLCAKDEIEIEESNGERLPARWYTVPERIATGLPLFPDGLLDLLNGRE